MSYQSRSLIVFYEYLSHQIETIHHDQHSSFLTNVTVGQSFSTKLDIFVVQSFSSWSVASREMRVKCVVSDLGVIQNRSLVVFYEYLSHRNETIHHHQHSSFLTNVTIGQSFSTKLDIFVLQSFSSKLERSSKCRVSLLDVVIGKRLQWSNLHFSLSLTQLSIIINTSVFWLTWLSNRVSWLTKSWSFFIWCHHQGQPWDAGQVRRFWSCCHIKAGLW